MCSGFRTQHNMRSSLVYFLVIMFFSLKYRLTVQHFKVFDVYFLPTGLQNSAEDSTLKWYKELQESAAVCVKSIEQLTSSKDSQVSVCFAE